MTYRILIGLVLSNVVWSANPAMSKLVLADFHPVHAAWLRYFSAFVAYFVGFVFLRRRRSALVDFSISKVRKKDWVLLVAMGFLTFCFTPLLQMTGLNASRAVDSALLMAIEPLNVTLFACIFLGERIYLRHGIAFILAIVGFVFLSELTPGRIAQGLDGHMVGNLIMLLALTGEASYSILGRKLLDRLSPVPVFGLALAVGVLFLSIATFIFAGVPPLEHLTARSVLGILWVGPLGTTITYLYWMFAMREASVVSLALTLFIQPILGAFLGYAFWGERLTLLQGVGAGLILMAVFGQMLFEVRTAERDIALNE